MRYIPPHTMHLKYRCLAFAKRAILIALVGLVLSVQGSFGRDIYILPDRLWAISGDTIWFLLSSSPFNMQNGNVAHVQLETFEHQSVTRAMLLIDQGMGKGYLVVPDALETGGYWLKAYQKSGDDAAMRSVSARLINVYHRFGEIYSVPESPAFAPSNHSPSAATLKLDLEADTVKRREELTIKVNIPSETAKTIRHLTLSGGYEDPAGHPENNFFLLREKKNSDEALPPENNGFYIEGRVTSAAALPEKILVLLTVPGKEPHFDYYLTTNNGYFRFKLSKTYGTAGLLLRVISPEAGEFGIELLTPTENTALRPSTDDTPAPREFVGQLKSMREAAQFARIFAGEQVPQEPYFRMEPIYPYPFYGQPDRRVIPAEFIELPNFMEISRELLTAVRFRQRAGGYQLQVLDQLERKFFNQSPLRLVNGIPVFDDDLLFRFRSSDIAYIDLINHERIFGDLSFKGVVAIVLNSDDRSWLSEEKNLFQFTVPALQPAMVQSVYRSEVSQPSALPDFRRALLFEEITVEQGVQEFTFNVSDLKGNVVIRLEGVTHNNEPFSIYRKITVE